MFSSKKDNAPPSFLTDFTTPLESNLISLIRSRLFTWHTTLNSLKHFLYEFTQASKEYNLRISKASAQLSGNIENSVGGYYGPFLGAALTWQVETSARTEFGSRLQEELDTIFNTFRETSKLINDTLEKALKAQEGKERSLSHVIQLLLRVWEQIAEGRLTKAIYNGPMPPDPWMHHRKLQVEIEHFMAAKNDFLIVLQNLFERTFSLHKEMATTLKVLVRKFTGEYGLEQLGEVSDWEHALKQYHLDHHWDLFDTSEEAFSSTILGLISGHIAEKCQLELQSFDIVRTGIVCKPTKGPRAWFAPAFSSAAWSRTTCILLTKSAFLHVYDAPDSRANILDDTARLFSPDYSLDMRYCAVAPTDSAHHIFTISVNSSSDKKDKKMALKCQNADDMVDWCVAIGNTTALSTKLASPRLSQGG